jgi:hypothetical protein
VVAPARRARKGTCLAGGDSSTGGDGGNVCAAIVADVQALVVPAIASLQNTVDGCIPLLAADGGQVAMQVLYGADADKSLYNQENGDMPHAITGIGDEAYWVELVPGASIPDLLAHKGNETCIVTPPEPPDTTCRPRRAAPAPSSTPSPTATRSPTSS